MRPIRLCSPSAGFPINLRCPRLQHWVWLILLFSGWSSLAVQAAVLSRSDVVFMYQADRDTYQRYGATVLAWGGKPTPQSAQQNSGIRVFGSVGMVTEFARFYERFPDSYREALCRDVYGQPVKVPWLTDHQHKGTPFWWCCTQQPLFRQYLRERVIETVKAGADGVHIDDHLGSAGGLWLGLCFCERCVEGFRAYLTLLPKPELQRFGIGQPENFNYRTVVLEWLAQDSKRKVTEHPLWKHWTIYQCRAAAASMQDLRDTAAQGAGHPVPIGANAGLLWPRHLADYKSVDLFSAETDHHAQKERFSDLPLLAYRLADAVERPYAATASGGDWAYIKEHNLPGLVQGWIALAYAAGHCFMVPHRQWCYTPEKGTHWYQGPIEQFAPLYQFVRQHQQLFEGYESYADVSIVLPHRSFVQDPNRWFAIGEQLAAKNIAYRVLLAGDEIVDHPLSAELLGSSGPLIVANVDQLLARDRQLLDQQLQGKTPSRSVAEVMEGCRPALQADPGTPVRLLPRVKQGSAVVHVLNWGYHADRDGVDPIRQLKLKLDLGALGVPSASTCACYQPGKPVSQLPISNRTLEIPEAGLWTILQLTTSR